MLAAHALEASTSLLLEEGMESVEARLRANIDYLARALMQIDGLELVSSRDAHRQSGILTFRVAGVASQPLYKKLMKENVVCAYRGGGVRFSPHFYTSKATLDLAVSRLRVILDQPRN